MMGSTLGSRPNYYETLGLTPTATAEEIERAYGRQIVQPRAFGGLAEIGIAYATLKDAAKRRAYDEVIGIAPKPQPVAASVMKSWQMTAPVHLNPAVQTLHRPSSSVPPQPSAQAPRESFIAASLRELANPEPLVRPEPRRPEAQAPQRVSELGPAPHDVPAEELDETAIRWQRPAAVGGGLLVAAVLLGAWAGTAVRDPDQPLDPEPRVTSVLPAATAPARETEASVGQAVSVPAAQPSAGRVRPRARTERAVAQAPKPMPRPLQLTAEEERELAGDEFADSAVQQAGAAAVAIQPAEPVVRATQAKLPLSERAVARTIGKIGYACGSVAAVSEAGTPGVFKVTCTSGHAYQARPVRGRYHFRRWSRP